MSALSVLSLRAAVHARLATDADLLDALGGARIYDVAPANAALPYVTFGPAQWSDWSQIGARGGDQILTLDVWSDYPGASEAIRIAERIADLLDDAALALTGHALVDLKLRSLARTREADGRLARASLSFRALTETLA